jgi:hypothetical protein
LKPTDTGGLADGLGGGRRPAARQREKSRRQLLGELTDLLGKLFDADREFRSPFGQVAGQPSDDLEELGCVTPSHPLGTAQNLSEALPAATDLITRVPHPAGGTGPIGRAITCVAVPEQVAVGLYRQHHACHCLPPCRELGAHRC